MSETIVISKENAHKALKLADEGTKKVLQALFGEKSKAGKVTDRIKTFEDACEEKGVDPFTILPYKSASNSFEKGINAMAKMLIIAEVLQEGWNPDWTNIKEWKYYPWYEYKAGFGFSDAGYGLTRAGTAVGSRLCFQTEELAKYFGTQFQPIINEFLNQ